MTESNCKFDNMVPLASPGCTIPSLPPLTSPACWLTAVSQTSWKNLDATGGSPPRPAGAQHAQFTILFGQSKYFPHFCLTNFISKRVKGLLGELLVIFEIKTTFDPAHTDLSLKITFELWQCQNYFFCLYLYISFLGSECVSSPREARAFHELRRNHTRPLWLNWDPKMYILEKRIFGTQISMLGF